jgi:hypothetical protein
MQLVMACRYLTHELLAFVGADADPSLMALESGADTAHTRFKGALIRVSRRLAQSSHGLPLIVAIDGAPASAVAALCNAFDPSLSGALRTSACACACARIASFFASVCTSVNGHSLAACDRCAWRD